MIKEKMNIQSNIRPSSLRSVGCSIICREVSSGNIFAISLETVVIGCGEVEGVELSEKEIGVETSADEIVVKGVNDTVHIAAEDSKQGLPRDSTSSSVCNDKEPVLVFNLLLLNTILNVVLFWE